MITLQEAHKLGLMTADYTAMRDEAVIVAELDFVTQGRGDWVECHFTCIRTGRKIKASAFKTPNGTQYTTQLPKVDFSQPNMENKTYMLVFKEVDGRVKWQKGTIFDI